MDLQNRMEIRVSWDIIHTDIVMEIQKGQCSIPWQRQTATAPRKLRFIRVMTKYKPAA